MHLDPQKQKYSWFSLISGRAPPCNLTRTNKDNLFCGQNTHSHNTFVHVQRITERSAQVQSLTTRTRVAQATTAQGLRIGVSSCLICCRTCHRTLLHDLPHLPQPSSDLLLPHCLVFRTWITKPCEIHGGAADILNQHLSTVFLMVFGKVVPVYLDPGSEKTNPRESTSPLIKSNW